MDKKQKLKLEATVRCLRKAAADMIAEADALERLMNEEPSQGQLATQLLDFFFEQWNAKYQSKYVVNGKKDVAMLKRLLGSLTAREIAVRMKVYLASTDRFFVDGKHNLTNFVGAINKLNTANPATYVVGCTHTPRCGSDAAHTQKMLKEARTA